MIDIGIKKLGRLINFLFSLVCIVFLLPILGIIALLIKIESNGPAIFKQNRVGKNEKTFTIYKFRSMRLHSETPAELKAIKHNHALVTRVGYFIRRFKLDELPQLWNVLRGEMSLIGPRPCLHLRIDQMSADERRRFNVLPGMTGWAEVNGNVELTWEEQLKLDLWYVDHKSIWLDLFIFFKTIAVVLFGSYKDETAIKRAENYLNNRV
jgi:undecaprenyl phosphate N,N'-diacetylbacillosamine 1-phosphate transferase